MEEEVADIELKGVTQRTLVVRGTRDRWCTRSVAEEYADDIPRGHYEHVDEVGHLVPEEDPQTLSRLIAAFVKTPESHDPTPERSEKAPRKLGSTPAPD